jgi:hypothetical protein
VKRAWSLAGVPLAAPRSVGGATMVLGTGPLIVARFPAASSTTSDTLRAARQRPGVDAGERHEELSRRGSTPAKRERPQPAASSEAT